MKTRTISAIVVGTLGVTVVIVGGVAMGVVLLLLSAIGLYEFYRAFEKKSYHPMKSVGVLFLILCLPAFFLKEARPMEFFLSAAPTVNLAPLMQLVLVLFTLALLVFRYDKYTAADGAISLFGGYYVVFLLSFFMLLRNMEHGRHLFLMALLGAIAADTFALLFGMMWGKHKLIPRVSPKKTVEGSLGAFVGAMLTLCVYGGILHVTDVVSIAWYHYCILGLLIGFFAQVGDLCASAIKRYTGIKDFGKLIPGHGGVLDRIDSYIYVIPVVYYYMQVLLQR